MGELRINSRVSQNATRRKELFITDHVQQISDVQSTFGKSLRSNGYPDNAGKAYANLFCAVEAAANRTIEYQRPSKPDLPGKD